MESSAPKKVKIALIGATGAIGREVLKWAKTEERVSEMALLVRRRLDIWNEEDFPFKLNYIERENFDDISELKD